MPDEWDLYGDEDEERVLLFTSGKPLREKTEIEAGEAQIIANMKEIRYIVREYPVNVIVQQYLRGKKFDKNEIFVPDYQRELVWPERNQVRFIESLLIGLPVPFLFVADIKSEDDEDKSGRLEIVDGVQRIRTLARFLLNDLVLTRLERLTALEGSRFCDLHVSRQRRFLRTTLRLIEFTEAATEDVRRAIFDRINTGSVGLEAVEVRRGMRPGAFLNLVSRLARVEKLHELAPVSAALQSRYEYEELVTRFFAYLNRYQLYGRGEEGKIVRDFLMSYVTDTNNLLSGPDGEALAQQMEAEWDRMLDFVERHVPGGFKKSGRGRKVPRVRFEAIAVGAGLALREKPDIDPVDLAWLDSDDFREWTTSDASNNRASLVGRIEFVRDALLQS